MMILEVNGIKYEGWTDVKITRNIEMISGSFHFSATSSNIVLFPIKAAQPCKVYIDKTMVINGYVDSVEVSYDAGSHNISISGRDRTCDLIDGTIVGIKEFQGMELVPIIEKILLNHNLSDIKVINKAGDITAEFPDLPQASSPISQTIFNFIETYARKRQVLLTTDGLGNIVLARAATGSALTGLQNIVNGTHNNILSGKVTYDLTKRFYKYILQSAQNPAVADIAYDDGSQENDTSDTDTGESQSNESAIQSNESVAVQTGEAIDDSIRKSRIIETIPKTTASTVDLGDLAEWTKNLAIARSIEYEVTVQDFFHDESKTKVWEPNILVQVNDDFVAINAIMLIKSVEYSLSLGGGSVTTLCLVDKDSYTLQLAIDSETNTKKAKKGVNSISDIVYVPPSS